MLGMGIAIRRMFTSLKSVSSMTSMKLHRDHEITQRFAWHMMHRSRNEYSSSDPLFSGTVESNVTCLVATSEPAYRRPPRTSHDPGCMRPKPSPVELPCVGHPYSVLQAAITDCGATSQRTGKSALHEARCGLNDACSVRTRWPR